MLKKSTPFQFQPFIQFAWIPIFGFGAIIGIMSQRIPEVRTYTDKLVQPIEKSEVLKQVKAKIAYPDETIYKTEKYIPQSINSPSPGYPISSFLIQRPGYSVAYDAHHRNPLWVYEHLKADQLTDSKEIAAVDFREDQSIPQHLQASIVDYRGHGLNKAPMASAVNHSSSQEELNAAFYMTNMCPQCPRFNQGYWAKLERHVRDLTKEYQNVYVTTGPLYLPANENSLRFVKYRVIGPHDVAVPSHFFKVLVLENKEGEKEMVAYILPNQEIPIHTPLNDFRTTVKNVEQLAGLIISTP